MNEEIIRKQKKKSCKLTGKSLKGDKSAKIMYNKRLRNEKKEQKDFFTHSRFAEGKDKHT